MEEFYNQEEQLKIIKRIGDTLLKIADNNINEKEVPSNDVLDTLRIALLIIAGLN